MRNSQETGSGLLVNLSALLYIPLFLRRIVCSLGNNDNKLVESINKRNWKGYYLFVRAQ